MYVNCEVCGKRIQSFQYNLSDYVYKRDGKYYCCYSHMRKDTAKKKLYNNMAGEKRFKNMVKRG